MSKPILLVRTNTVAAQVVAIRDTVTAAVGGDYHVIVVADDAVDKVEFEVLSEATQCAKNSNPYDQMFEPSYFVEGHEQN